ncbi:MAG: DUF3048 domain-containing protein [Ilumatobacteraceae bacterium]
MRERIRLVVVLCAASGLLVAACGGSAGGDDVVAQQADPTPTTVGEDFDGPRNTETAPTTTVAAASTTVRVAPSSTTTDPSPPPIDAPLVSSTLATDDRSVASTSVPDGGDSSGSSGSSGNTTAQIPVPSWPPYSTRPGLTDVGALTGLPVTAAVAGSPIVVVKIDNHSRARPQWDLDRADVIFEENVEGTTRFLALFHSDVPAEIGPVRSARTTDMELLPAMNRPVLAWSGGNAGVTKWVDAA